MGACTAAAVDPTVQAAAAALSRGEIVLLYDDDGREGETDMVIASEHLTAGTIGRMRQDAGGLVCTALAPEHHEALGLPFLSDLIQQAALDHPALQGLLPDDIRYDGCKPAFGLTLNHRGTFTGVTDEDRSLTIRALAGLCRDSQTLSPAHAQERLAKEFRSPGHVMLLNGAPGGLTERQGHTELSLALARLAGTVPCTTVCEMMDPASGKARSKKDAQAYAAEHGLVFLTGQDVVNAWYASTPTPASPAPTSA